MPEADTKEHQRNNEQLIELGLNEEVVPTAPPQNVEERTEMPAAPHSVRLDDVPSIESRMSVSDAAKGEQFRVNREKKRVNGQETFPANKPRFDKVRGLVNQKIDINRRGKRNAKAQYAPHELETSLPKGTEGPLPKFTTKTAGGAWLANHISGVDITNNGADTDKDYHWGAGAAYKEKIGNPDEYMGKRTDKSSSAYQHLEEFYSSGAHAFITPIIDKKIRGEEVDERFKGWGADANFVATKASADKMFEKHKKSRPQTPILSDWKPGQEVPEGLGLAGLELELGIPPGQWMEGNEASEIIRYSITDKQTLEKLNLRMASGREMQAYGSGWSDYGHKGDFQFQPGNWESGGFTDQGNKEAVLDAIPRTRNHKVAAARWDESGEFVSEGTYEEGLSFEEMTQKGGPLNRQVTTELAANTALAKTVDGYPDSIKKKKS